MGQNPAIAGSLRQPAESHVALTSLGTSPKGQGHHHRPPLRSPSTTRVWNHPVRPPCFCLVSRRHHQCRTCCLLPARVETGSGERIRVDLAALPAASQYRQPGRRVAQERCCSPTRQCCPGSCTTPAPVLPSAELALHMGRRSGMACERLTHSGGGNHPHSAI